MGQRFGYARVSTKEQNLEIQLEALKKAGCDVIRSEKTSGTTRKNRTELETLLEFIREGDTLVVTRIDRLARSISDLYAILNHLKERGASFEAIEQNVETKSAAGKAMLGMLGVFAEFESDIRRERQIEGIAKAKAAGKYRGAKKRHDDEEIRRLVSSGLSKAETARHFGCSEMTVYRALNPGKWIKKLRAKVAEPIERRSQNDQD